MINILPFKQTDSSMCGPSVIKMILWHYGQDVLEKEIAERCEHTYDRGCNDAQMMKAIESYGLAVFAKNYSTLEDLEYWVRHHIPVIVDWFTPGPGGGSIDEMGHGGHSGVVVDIDREKVYLMDPEIGAIRAIRRDEFLRVWYDWHTDATISNSNLVKQQAIVVYPGWLKNPPVTFENCYFQKL